MKFLAVLAQAATNDIGIGEAVSISLAGYGIVFAVLVTLLLLVLALSAIMNRVDAVPATQAAASVPAAAPTAVAAKPAAPAAIPAGKMLAPGSVGECDMHSVDDKTAALLMAIVADQMNTPLNELRFLSIKELGEGQS